MKIILNNPQPRLSGSAWLVDNEPEYDGKK